MLFGKSDNSAKIAKQRLMEVTRNDRSNSIPNIEAIKTSIKDVISKYTSDNIVILASRTPNNDVRIMIEIIKS